VLASRGELPLILQRPVRGPHGQAVLALLTPAGALFDGDVVELEVECEAGSDVTLTTAAATRLNRCDGDGIEVQMHVRVDDGATFRYLPHELIPFAGARYRQQIEVEVAPAGAAALLEVIGPGPSAAPFAYDALEFATSVCAAGRLSARERFSVSSRSVRQFGEWTHYGSLLALGVPTLATVSCAGPVQLAGSALPGGGVVVKALGSSAQALRAALVDRLCSIDWLHPLLPP